MNGTRGDTPGEMAGLIYGGIGIFLFGLTLPATRLAVASLDAVFVGLGRGVAAAMVAAIILLVTGEKPPQRRDWPLLAMTSAGVVIGFPLFATLAMQWLPAAHGGVVLAFLPLATAVAAALFSGERPGRGFWFWSLLGALIVLVFMLLRSGGARVQMADMLLVAATLCAAMGYATGGRLSRHLGGWQVICWSLVIGAPVLLLAVVLGAEKINWDASATAWGGFFYVALFSQLVGFFAWNRGLALGGVARIGQLQLFQPFVTLAASALVLSEAIGWVEAGFALAVVATVAAGRKTTVRRGP
jgi:drug/metabolite transporter (DMT)-like permease